MTRTYYGTNLDVCPLFISTIYKTTKQGSISSPYNSFEHLFRQEPFTHGKKELEWSFLPGKNSYKKDSAFHSLAHSRTDSAFFVRTFKFHNVPVSIESCVALSITNMVL